MKSLGKERKKKEFTMWMVGCPWKELAVRNGKIPRMFYMSKKQAVHISKLMKIENHPYPEPVMKCTVIIHQSQERQSHGE